MLITIETKLDKINVNLSKDATFPDAIQALASTAKQLAISTIEQVTITQTNKAIESAKDAKVQPSVKGLAEGIRDSVTEDVADMLNFAFSNVLQDISPKDPELELTEKAIAAAENLIVKQAAKEGITLKQALDRANVLLEKALDAKA